MSSTARLVSAGAACVAVTFGLARYGYGLMLPDLRAALDLDSAILGLIGSGSFAAYLLATASSGLLAARVGARRLVVAGGALAVAGMAIVASAQSGAALAAGIVVAGASSGLVFPPFADAVQQRLPAERRPRALAIISSGTGWGVLVSVPIARAGGGGRHGGLGGAPGGVLRRRGPGRGDHAADSRGGPGGQLGLSLRRPPTLV